MERNLDAAGCKDANFTGAALPPLFLTKVPQPPGNPAKGCVWASFQRSHSSSRLYLLALWQSGVLASDACIWKLCIHRAPVIPFHLPLHFPTPTALLIPILIRLSPSCIICFVYCVLGTISGMEETSGAGHPCDYSQSSQCHVAYQAMMSPAV